MAIGKLRKPKEPKKILDWHEETARLQRERYELDHPEPVFKHPIRAWTLIALNVVLGLWFATVLSRARDQREAIAEIKKVCGEQAGVHYDYQRTDSGWDDDAPLPGPPVLRNLMWVDFFAHVVEVHNMASENAVVYLSGFPRLQEFRIDPGTHVTAALLQGLEKQKELRRLTITDPKFGDAEAAGLAGLIQLVSLNLSGTKITDEGLKNLAEMSQLKSLDLSSTAIWGFGLEHIQSLTQLQYLRLDNTQYGNGIGRGATRFLQELPQLRRLDLSGTDVSDADLPYLKGMTRLEDLRFSSNKVTDAALKSIEGLTQLEVLQIGGFVTDAGLNSLRGLTQLRVLHVDGAYGGRRRQITAAGVENIKRMTRLEDLSLTFSDITDPGLESLEVLTRLRMLDLSSNKITDAGLQHLQGLTELRMLDISRNEIKGPGLKWLRGLAQLEELSMSEVAYGFGGDSLENLAGLPYLLRLDVSRYPSFWPDILSAWPRRPVIRASRD